MDRDDTSLTTRHANGARPEASAPTELWFLNTWVTIRRASDASPDGVSIMEHHLPCADSPPLHVHHDEDEIFHVLEGEVTLAVGEAQCVVRAGETRVAPRGVPHSYRVDSPAGARVLTIVPGRAFETFVRQASRPATARALPEPIAPTPDMIAWLARTAADHRIDLVGPPMSPA